MGLFSTFADEVRSKYNGNGDFRKCDSYASKNAWQSDFCSNWGSYDSSEKRNFIDSYDYSHGRDQYGVAQAD